VTADLKTVFIDDGDPGYSQVVQALADAFSQRMCVPFLGAGISRAAPSCLPLARDLIPPLVEAMWSSAAEVWRPYPPNDSECLRARLVLGRARLEKLLDVLQQTHGPAALRYLEVLDGQYWNTNHAALAGLSSAGKLPYCITLNFDLLIESAMDAAGAAHETECPLLGKRFAGRSCREGTMVVKPHGSFALPASKVGRMDYVAATLSQVGNRPAAANRDRIAEVLRACPVLLVSGYSDDDWDIFPILRGLSHYLDLVIWVQHATVQEVRVRDHRSTVRLGRVKSWLRNLGPRGWLVIGDTRNLLRDCLLRLSVDSQGTSSREAEPQRPDSTVFVNAPGKTALSLAILLQEGGERRFNRRLLEWLGGHAEILANPMLLALRHKVLAFNEHTEGRIREAIGLNEKAISLEVQHPGLADDALADDLVWLGYEYLCLAKRPWGRELFLLPVHVLKGLILMRRGCRSSPAGRMRREIYARYYRTDIVHCWLEPVLLLGPQGIGLFHWAFRLLEARYAGLAKQNSLLMGWEYYWLRHLETWLLAGGTAQDGEWGDREVQAKIDDIRQAYLLTQNDVQVGNAFAYSALHKFVRTGDKQESSRLLSKAEAHWRSLSGYTFSGLLRVILFRRFMGLIHFPDACRQLAALVKQARAESAARKERSKTREAE
jgi:hypothetical protein